MLHSIIGILLLVLGCLLQLLPVQIFAPWGSHPVARREICRIPILVVGAAQFWVGLRDLVPVDEVRFTIFGVCMGIVACSLLYVVWKCSRRV
jgi:hypothetical protein